MQTGSIPYNHEPIIYTQVYEEVTNLLWSNYSCHSNRNNDVCHFPFCIQTRVLCVLRVFYSLHKIEKLYVKNNKHINNN